MRKDARLVPASRGFKVPLHGLNRIEDSEAGMASPGEPPTPRCRTFTGDADRHSVCDLLSFIESVRRHVMAAMGLPRHWVDGQGRTGERVVGAPLATPGSSDFILLDCHGASVFV